METGLYVVATPIGNLGDITARAIEVLRGVDLVAAEDTRHTANLFRHFAINSKLMAYHDHSSENAIARVEEILAQAGAVALVSDAGTPLISDPGYRLLQRVLDKGYPVIPVPGACAAIAALSVAGIPTDRFQFEGFLPAKKGARIERLQQLCEQPSTLVFYEAPHRVLDALTDFCEIFGTSRRAVLAREITKTYETLLRDNLGNLCRQVKQDSNQRRGEIVMLVEGSRQDAPAIDAPTAKLLAGIAESMPARRAAALVAEYTGLRKNQLYQHLVDTSRE